VRRLNRGSDVADIADIADIAVIVCGGRPNRVRGNVVIEVTIYHRALRDIHETSLYVIAAVQCAGRAQVPMVAAHQFVEHERGRRPGDEHCPSPVVVRRQRLTIAAIQDLELLVATHERLVAWLDREQHLYPACRVGMQHQYVAVLRGAKIYPRPVATSEAVSGAQPDLDLRIIGKGDGRWACSGPGRRRCVECKCKREHHKTPL